jgi:hypothetical protein
MPIIVRVARTPIAEIANAPCTTSETIAKLRASGWQELLGNSPHRLFTHPEVTTRHEAAKLLADADVGYDCCEIDEQDPQRSPGNENGPAA